MNLDAIRALEVVAPKQATGGRTRLHMDGLVLAFVLGCTLSFVLGWAIGAAT